MARTKSRAAKSSTSEDASRSALLARLFEELAEDEIWHVLTGALLSLDDDGRERLFERLHPETRAALKKALAPPRERPKTKPRRATSSDARTLWDRLWNEWNACVEESNKERGRYTLQEHDWDDPYTDFDALAGDLDALAAQWEPLLPRLLRDPDVQGFSFYDALRELDEDAATDLPEGYPDASDMDFVLGRALTQSALVWEHAAAKREGHDAFEWIEELVEFCQELDHTSLDEDVVVKFVTALPDDELRAILEGVSRARSKPPWKDALASPHTPWFRIAVALARRWDRPLHDALSRSHIDRDWTLAVPLLDELVRRKDFDGALTLAREAADALGSHDRKTRWAPERTFFLHLVGVHAFSLREKNPQVEKLLALWSKAAHAKGATELAVALDLQVLAQNKIADGDAMLGAFAAVAPELAALRERLYADWRAILIERTLGHTSARPDAACEWVSALVDAAREGESGAPKLREAVRAALDAVATHKPKPRSPSYSRYDFTAWDSPEEHAWHSAARLLLDLDAQGEVRRAAPAFVKLIDTEHEAARDPWLVTRRKWFERLGGAQLLSVSLDFWKAHIVRRVPDPSTAQSSSYETNVEWFVAVRELNPAASDVLLAQWATQHKNRKNLWKAMAARKMPVPAGVTRPRR